MLPDWFDPSLHFEGAPCNYGGHTIRYLKNKYRCVVCAKASALEKCRANPDKIKEANKQYYELNREKLIADAKRREVEYKTRGVASILEARKRAEKKYRSNRPELPRYFASKRRAAKLRRTPPWADLEAIQKIYDTCPVGMEVDHIYPLQGELVSGLHVANNLQYLDPIENRRKNNRCDPKLLEWEIYLP